MRNSVSFIGAMCVALLLAACGDRKSTPQPVAPGAGAKVLATVNGKPITDADVRHASRRIPAGAPNHDASANVLQTLVRDELMSQKAAELGLDADPEYSLKIADLEAQLNAFRRQQLGLLYRSYVRQHATVTDAEARAYFEKNAALMQGRFHVSEIFRKGNFAEIEADLEALKAGRSFEEVASRGMPALPAGVQRPWDLGELRWNQVPPAWRGTIERLQPGQYSEVLKGENDRFWIVKLEGRSVDPSITFDSEKDRIVDVLRQQKADELQASMIADANARARIVYAK